jgi:hypothetical protein
MKRLALLSILLLSSGCANVPAPAPFVAEIPKSDATPTPPASPSQTPIRVKPTIPTRANVLLARTAVKQNLKDPESARFVGEIQQAEAICGFVNSKNSYGGYVGDSPYIYVNATRNVYILQHSGTLDQRIAQLKALDRYCPTEGH